VYSSVTSMDCACGNNNTRPIASAVAWKTRSQDCPDVLFRINMALVGPASLPGKKTVCRKLTTLYYIALTKFATHSFLLPVANDRDMPLIARES
jgi:hypothetical protein